MNILINIKDITGDVPNPDWTESDLAAIKGEIAQSVRSQFEDQAADKEAYIAEIEDSDFVLGVTDPDEVIRQAKDWNACIQRDVLATIGVLLHSAGAACMGTLPMDNQDTYQLRLAVMALDDAWHCFARKTVYANNSSEYSYFRCILSDDMLQDIISNPSNYALLRITVK